MFSGLVDHCGTVEAVERHEGALRLWIRSLFKDLAIGESVSVDGACLTVTADKSGTLRCDVSPETLRLTIASGYEPGTRVNLERALRVGDRLGGHWVTGHVDTTLTLSQREERSDCLWLRFDGIHARDRALVMRKGCVSVNGVSLTVNEVGPTYFTVLLVPHTRGATTLAELAAGSPVNIEWDWMAKVVQQALQTRFSREDSNDEPHPFH